MKKTKTKQQPKNTHVTKAQAGKRAERLESILQCAYEKCIPQRKCKITTVAFHLDVGYPAVRQWITRGVPVSHIHSLAVLAGVTEETIRRANSL